MKDLHFNWFQWGHIKCSEHFAFEQVGGRDYSLF